MPGLLVSVRSAEEARLAVIGGASIIDVKEPACGPLGCADTRVWQSVREVVPEHIPVSVALGELGEWKGRSAPPIEAFRGISFRKIGVGNAGANWATDWATLRDRWGGLTNWIAVVYADFEAANSPRPEEIIEAARESRCAGVLIDSWDKTRPSPLRATARWIDCVQKIREFGIVVVAGGLNASRIAPLMPLEPDFFAVRGAVCEQGHREAAIDPKRVRKLVAVCSGKMSSASSTLTVPSQNPAG